MRNRVYFNTDKLCFSLLDYKTNKVVKYADNIFMTNALFVVRKSGQKRVREEGRKNVHAFVNGIIQNRLPNNQDLFYNCHSVRYNPYTMDYFHLPFLNGKPNIYADIDNISSVSNPSKLHKTSSVDQTFLKRKRKIIENKNKIIDKTIAI
jgi:hypothetical protein